MSLSREQLEAAHSAKVAAMRARADVLQTQADKINATVPTDYAYWTQPVVNTSGGRAFESRRQKARDRMHRASSLGAEATKLRKEADRLEAQGVRVAGDAKAAHDARVDACAVEAGQMVDTTFYGVRRVLKVNRVSVLVEGAFGPLKVGKEFVRLAA